MPKHILVLTASPRTGGNTDILAEAFIKGAQQNPENKVTRIDTGRLHVGGCIACDQCYTSEERPCIFADDFNKIAPELVWADALVFITPLYWYTFPAQLKAVIDKFYSLASGKGPDLKATESALIVTGADDTVADYDGVIKTYQIIAEYKKWEDKGVLVVPGMENKGQAADSEYLAKAEELGRQF